MGSSGINAVGIHPYDMYTMSHVERIKKVCDGKEIWLTEFNAGSGDHAELIRQVVPELEKDSQIGGYLWFAESAPLSNDNGDLTDIGTTFDEVVSSSSVFFVSSSIAQSAVSLLTMLPLLICAHLSF